jgi:hypothetical protein
LDIDASGREIERLDEQAVAAAHRQRRQLERATAVHAGIGQPGTVRLVKSNVDERRECAAA